MKTPKSALKYFVRLIKLDELVDRRAAFHRAYAARAKADSGLVYDEASERAEYEELTVDLNFVRVIVDFKQQLCSEVATKSKKSKAVIYERLTTGSLAEQQLLYLQVLKDVVELLGIVAEQQLYTDYLCIPNALVDIRKFIVSHKPQKFETSLASTPDSVEEQQVTSHQYKYLKAGTLTEDKALTRHYLGELFHKLRDELRLVAPDTSVEDFRAIFSGKVVLNPVVWFGTNAQLRHFFKSIESKLVPLAGKKPGKWVVVAASFTHRDGESFTAAQLQSTGTKDRDVLMIDELEKLGSVLR